VRTLLSQIEQSLQTRLYYLSLMSALTVPDIAGVLDAENEWATKEKYQAWFDRWVGHHYVRPKAENPPPWQDEVDKLLPWPPTFDGAACWAFRCSLLHQGRTRLSKTVARVVFIEPGATGAPSMMHQCMLGPPTEQQVYVIDLGQFCREMIAGARAWLTEVEHTELFRRNYESFARRHPRGIPGRIDGLPLIG
jgi:hypothetical protein